jgi:hypothetical protein
MNEIIEQRKKIIGSYFRGRNLVQNTTWNKFWLTFSLLLVLILVPVLIVVANYAILNKFLQLSDRVQWDRAGLFISMTIMLMINLIPTFTSHYLYKHYHSLDDGKVPLTEESNMKLWKFLEKYKHPRFNFTLIVGIIIAMTGFISYLSESTFIWEHLWAAFLMFQALYFFHYLYRYLRDFKQLANQ